MGGGTSEMHEKWSENDNAEVAVPLGRRRAQRAVTLPTASSTRLTMPRNARRGSGSVTFVANRSTYLNTTTQQHRQRRGMVHVHQRRMDMDLDGITGR